MTHFLRAVKTSAENHLLIFFFLNKAYYSLPECNQILIAYSFKQSYFNQLLMCIKQAGSLTEVFKIDLHVAANRGIIWHFFAISQLSRH